MSNIAFAAGTSKADENACHGFSHIIIIQFLRTGVQFKKKPRKAKPSGVDTAALNGELFAAKIFVNCPGGFASASHGGDDQVGTSHTVTRGENAFAAGDTSF